MGSPANKFLKLQTQKLANDKKRDQVLPTIEKLLQGLGSHDADTRLEIGIHYLSFEDFTSASQWLHDSANLGSREAMFFLGRLDLAQKSNPMWLVKAAEQGDPDAAAMLAAHFQKTGQLESSIRWHEWLIDRGELQLFDRYFDALLEQGDTDKVLSIVRSTSVHPSRFVNYVSKALLSRACSQSLLELVLGDSRSQPYYSDAKFLFLLGQAFNGLGDKESATEWFQRSYQAGNLLAKVWLDMEKQNKRW